MLDELYRDDSLHDCEEPDRCDVEPHPPDQTISAQPSDARGVMSRSILMPIASRAGAPSLRCLLCAMLSVTTGQCAAGAGVGSGGCCCRSHGCRSGGVADRVHGPVAVRHSGVPAACVFRVALVSAAVVVLVARAHLRIVTAAGLIVLMVSAGLGIGSTADRQAPATTAASASTKAGQLRILSWNTNQQDVTAQHLGELMDSEQANVVALPEYFTGIAEGTLAEPAQRHNMQIIGTDSSSATLLISNHLGSYPSLIRKGRPLGRGLSRRPMIPLPRPCWWRICSAHHCSIRAPGRITLPG